MHCSVSEVREASVCVFVCILCCRVIHASANFRKLGHALRSLGETGLTFSAFQHVSSRVCFDASHNAWVTLLCCMFDCSPVKVGLESNTYRKLKLQNWCGHKDPNEKRRRKSMEIDELNRSKRRRIMGGGAFVYLTCEQFFPQSGGDQPAHCCTDLILTQTRGALRPQLRSGRAIERGQR